MTLLILRLYKERLRDFEKQCYSKNTSNNFNDNIEITNVLCLVIHLCPTLSDSRNCNPPGSSVHRISQARILEWVIISSSREKIFQDCAQVDFLANQDRSRQTSRIFKILQGKEINRGSAHLLGFGEWFRLIWRVHLAKK